MHPCQEGFQCVYLSSHDKKCGKCMLAECQVKHLEGDDGQEWAYDKLRGQLTPWYAKPPSDDEYDVELLEKQQAYALGMARLQKLEQRHGVTKRTELRPAFV